MVIDSNRKVTLRAVLTDDVLVEEFLDVARLGPKTFFIEENL